MHLDANPNYSGLIYLAIANLLWRKKETGDCNAQQSSLLYLFNVAISWGLLVLIWLVQIVIYPGLERIPSAGFKNYHRWYVTRISIVVLPLMLSEETITIGWLILNDSSLYAEISALMVVIIWLSTFTLQVPIHQRLQAGKDESRIRRLVNSNWIRTIAWSIKAVVVTAATVAGFA